jgi:NAD(P)-dependent dehydrogenase (short-subunit alcohol dehydrogenase family)
MDLNTAKHAFITGGASGIGLGIAEALAARGLAVTIADADGEALEAVAPPRGFDAQLLDTRDREGWARVKALAEAAHGPVDVLINNAGIAPNGMEFADMDPVSFDRIIAINLTGIFNGISAFAADMRARGAGHIVNTSSMAGLQASVPGVGAYAAAKFGVTGMSEALRKEMSPHGVGVSVLCPGYVHTNIAASTAKMGGELRGGGGAMPPSGLSPADVGEMVAAGIEANALYIITHPDNWPGVGKRMAALAAAFGQD